MTEKIGAVLVVGGGIGGMQSSLDLANSGFKVYLLDSSPVIGGTMAQLDKTFPTNDCAMCIMAPKLVEVGRHPNIDLITYSDLKGISGKPGNFRVKVLKKPRYIDEEKCTGCGSCSSNCPVRYKVYIMDEKEVEIDLPAEDVEKVKEIITKHKDEKGPLMPILQDINTEFNYLPRDVLRYTAQELNISLSRIYNIATFYNAFSLTPRGRHTISVCMGTTCYVRGSEKILNALERELNICAGGTTEDRRFSLETVRCLGCCSLSPALKIGDDTYGRLKQNELRGVLKEYD